VAPKWVCGKKDRNYEMQLIVILLLLFKTGNLLRKRQHQSFESLQPLKVIALDAIDNECKDLPTKEVVTSISDNRNTFITTVPENYIIENKDKVNSVNINNDNNDNYNDNYNNNNNNNNNNNEKTNSPQVKIHVPSGEEVVNEELKQKEFMIVLERLRNEAYVSKIILKNHLYHFLNDKLFVDKFLVCIFGVVYS
jgi:hypothetical protein